MLSNKIYKGKVCTKKKSLQEKNLLRLGPNAPLPQKFCSLTPSKYSKTNKEGSASKISYALLHASPVPA